MDHHVLFLGLTNHCASRFAEILFNHFASEQLLNFSSISRGVTAAHHNEPIDPRTLNALTARGVLMSGQLRAPKTVKSTDIEHSQYIVLISGDELVHRLGRAKRIEDKQVIIWNFDRVKDLPSHELYPALEAEVYLLVRRLQQHQYQYVERITA